MFGEVLQVFRDVRRVTGCTGRSRKCAESSGGLRDGRGNPAGVRGRLEGGGMDGEVPQGRKDFWRATGCSGRSRKCAGTFGG